MDEYDYNAVGLLITIIAISVVAGILIGFDSEFPSPSYQNSIRPPADLPKNTHIECTGDGILTYIPWYSLNKTHTYSIEYGTNLSSVQKNGTWMIRDNNHTMVWCR